MRVLGLLADDLTNREIGERLGISHETVKTHLANALSKIGASDRVEGAQIVRRDGLG
jgi:DNA-binding NarL/FixJ family response regulator